MLPIRVLVQKQLHAKLPKRHTCSALWHEPTRLTPELLRDDRGCRGRSPALEHLEEMRQLTGHLAPESLWVHILRARLACPELCYLLIYQLRDRRRGWLASNREIARQGSVVGNNIALQYRREALYCIALCHKLQKYTARIHTTHLFKAAIAPLSGLGLSRRMAPSSSAAAPRPARCSVPLTPSTS